MNLTHEMLSGLCFISLNPKRASVSSQGTNAPSPASCMDWRLSELQCTDNETWEVQEGGTRALLNDTLCNIFLRC